VAPGPEPPAKVVVALPLVVVVGVTVPVGAAVVFVVVEELAGDPGMHCEYPTRCKINI
jgi:hypothetical protein